MEFKGILILLIVSGTLSTIILGASYLLGNKQPDMEKVSVYECGFDPFDNPGNPFSVRFFLIGILFLIFDLEISFLFPWSVTYMGLPLFGYWVVMLFLFILTLGLVYEWIEGGLEWEN
uniref:NADH-ubiquinone oxidoreductase chain 3 n=3 Tax=Scleralcyonacea TaxID=3028851 RepID=A0A516MVL8_9CNID|nr:NADH dehydrogenase subunit 3 [Pennatula aculeata]QDP70690.1 NADH dehydrogenase subunit 3 [Pennatula aculeata]QDP70704.1 NADH dehydrogenase subunit 3 [Pennatula cf. aculeata RH-2019]